VFGRSDQADVQVAHPSLSRNHAVVLHMMVGTDGEEKKVTPLVHSLLSHCSVLGRRLRPGPTASTRLLKNRPWTAAWDRSDGPRLRTRDHHQRQKDQSKDAGGLLLPRLATRVFCLFLFCSVFCCWLTETIHRAVSNQGRLLFLSREVDATVRTHRNGYGLGC